MTNSMSTHLLTLIKHRVCCTFQRKMAKMTQSFGELIESDVEVSRNHLKKIQLILRIPTKNRISWVVFYLQHNSEPQVVSTESFKDAKQSVHHVKPLNSSPLGLRPNPWTGRIRPIS
jgi:hypothetical protein